MANFSVPANLNIPKMGIKIPNMGMKTKPPLPPPRTSLADALFSTTRQRVLAFLFGQPERSFFATELIGLAGGGSGAVQRELARLAQSGLVTVTRVGTQKHYQANPESPIFAELCGITQKTVGLAKLGDHARINAIGFGKFASGTGEIPHLPGIDHSDWQPGSCQHSRGEHFQAARGFQHDKMRVECLHPGKQFAHTHLIVGKACLLRRWQYRRIQTGFADINSNNAFV